MPRHPERAAVLCDLVTQRGLRTVRWSEVGDQLPSLDALDVVVVDTIGQLQRFYAACDVAFVGGSLIPHGGQNMLEPAAQGRAVIFGPHTDNFRRDVELLLRADAAVQVRDRTERVQRRVTLAHMDGVGDRVRALVPPAEVRLPRVEPAPRRRALFQDRLT